MNTVEPEAPAANRIYLSPPDVGDLERKYLLEAFDSNWIAPLGPFVEQFETDLSRFIGDDHFCLALNSGTSALHLALLGVGVGPEDDVFVSTFTFVATANAVRYIGANPVFIDSEEWTWGMDPELLEGALKKAAAAKRLPKAVVVTDLYGCCADYSSIVPICRSYGVPLIEDAAEALGSTHCGRPAGTFGDAGVFSFNGNKIITMSSGGMLVSTDKEFVDRARYLATQARQPVLHYQHDDVGYNYRASNLLAAVGVGQLERLPEMIAARLQTFDTYKTKLTQPGLKLGPNSVGENSVSNRWLSCVLLSSQLTPLTPTEICQRLHLFDIESRPIWKPMHLQPLFAGNQSYLNGVADAVFSRGLCLPSGSSLSDGERDFVIQSLLSIIYS